MRIEGTEQVHEFSLDEFTPRREYNEIVIPKTQYRDLRRILIRVLPSGTGPMLRGGGRIRGLVDVFPVLFVVRRPY
jgi:hypothetical protein